MAETEDLKSFQCRFESDWGHVLKTVKFLESVSEHFFEIIVELCIEIL